MTGTADTDLTSDAATGFDTLGLRDELLAALDRLGYEEPTPIQRETIPLIISGRDLLGQAATGTGKTAAFALPALQMLDTSGRPSPQVLVLVPTRELAMQVAEAVSRYGKDLGAVAVPVFGGQPIFRQLQQLDRGAHVVVATPGRALDHIGRGSLPLDGIKLVVLDEADEMLDMGFAEDIETILESTPDSRQTVLFSATMPSRVSSIAKRHQHDPVRVQIAKAGPGGSTPSKIRQTVYVVPRSHKPAALGRILDIESPGAAIVFCRTRGEVDDLTETMNMRGYRAEALHGGMDQAGRDRVMGRLRDGTAELLIATDVAARGLDVDTLTHVVNYDVPSAAESYVHRIGRVGRAGRDGVAITLAEPKEQRLIKNIEQLTKQQLTIAPVPTVADLRARQSELTVQRVDNAADGDELDAYEPLLRELLTHRDLRAVALAALKLVHESEAPPVDEPDIPDASARFAERPKSPVSERSAAADGPTAYIQISLGRGSGVRPADLVGAIANQAGLTGRQIGPIRIADKYSVVGVPEGAVDTVLDAMKGAIIRGNDVRARRWVDKGGSGPAKPHRGQGGDKPYKPSRPAASKGSWESKPKKKERW